MFLAFLVSVLLRRSADSAGDMMLVACCSAMFLLGFVDDIVQLRPHSKLIGQIITAVVFTMFGMRLHWLSSAVLDQALTVFWLVGITNALNLLDNLDGAAAGVAAIAGVFVVYFSVLNGQHAVATLAAAFSGVVLGFLIFNFNPASIFMGDCGSLFLGFFLGGVTMVNGQPGARRKVLAVLLVPVLLLLIPIIDTTLVTVMRKLHGRPLSQGGRDHTTHRLVALGLSERGAALTLYLLSVISGGAAVLVSSAPAAVAALVIPLFGISVLLFLIVLGKVKVYAPAGAGTSGRGAFLPTLADFAFKRRIFEVLLDVCLITLAYYGAFLLRFEWSLTEPYYSRMLSGLHWVIIVQLACLWASGLYKGIWRYTSLSDLGSYVRAVGMAWLGTAAVMGVGFRFEAVSRAALIMDGILLFLAISGSRVGFRYIQARLLRFRSGAEGSRVLIYGAGDAGELLLREIRNNDRYGLLAVGFIDDDPRKAGRVIHGIKVLGPSSALLEVVPRLAVAEVIVSTDQIPPQHLSALNSSCEKLGLATRRLRIRLEAA